jgi:hypothetical protein
MNRKQTVRSIVSFALCVCVALPGFAGRDDDADRVSKNGRASGTIDGVEVTLEYGRPNVKGRTVWGDLVPFGKVWRSGANEATTITFSRDAMIQGEVLSAGTYALFTIPSADTWTVIFNKTADQWGAFNHDVGQDALRVTVQPRTGDMVESLDFQVGDSAVTMHWEELVVPFEVSAAK